MKRKVTLLALFTLASFMVHAQTVPCGSTPTFASLPYFQGFESWSPSCYSTDLPGNSWRLTPTYGDNSWRRDDQGSDAGWPDPAEAYAPISTEGAHSARFNSIVAGSSGYSGGTSNIGSMDLYVDLSATGTKQISFDYNSDDNRPNPTSLTVMISTDTGNTWTTIGQFAYSNAIWTQAVITTNVTAHAVIRFQCTAANPYPAGDFGLDSLNIIVLTTCSGTPAAGIATTQASGCATFTPSLSVTGNYGMDGFTYQWQSSPNGSAYTNISGATNAAYSAPITANIYYKATITCSNGNAAATTPAQEEQIVTPVATYAALPYFQGFENWIGSCYNYDRPDAHWIETPTYGDNSWRRDDQGYDAGWDCPPYFPYTPFFIQGNHSARFHSNQYGWVNSTATSYSGTTDLYADLSGTGTKAITFDYINADPSYGSNLTVLISTDTGNTWTQIGQYYYTPNWALESINTTVSVPAIIRFQGNVASYTIGDMGIDSFTVALLPLCTGTPAAGVISASQTSGCAEYTSAMSLTVANVNGLTYQWQSSADNNTFTNVSGATNTSYNADIINTTYYRAIVTCTNSNAADTTPSVELYGPPVTIYATLPYFQGFESWIPACYTYDRPDSSWSLTPSYGGNSWRRDDQGSDAGWTNNNGAYTPASTQGLHSARFHAQEALGSSGSMDLHINLSPAGTKQIAFDYYSDDNGATPTTLTVLISTDSGANFTQLAQYTYSANSLFQPEVITTNVTTAHAIIRFEGTATYGPAGDLGIDSMSISVQTACSGAPVANIITSQNSGCGEFLPSLSVVGNSNVSGITYQWQTSTNGSSFSNLTGETNATYIPDVTANTYYRAIATCTNGNATATTPAIEEQIVTATPIYALLPYSQSFENWIGTCFNYDRPDKSWLLSPTTGNDSWRRDDQGDDAGWTLPLYAAYVPAASDSAHSARYHSYEAAYGTGNMDLYVDLSVAGTKQITFDYLNNDANYESNLAVMISTDTGQTWTTIWGTSYYTGGWSPQSIATTITSPAIIRFQGVSYYYVGGDMGIDNLHIVDFPPCTGTPSAGTITGAPDTACAAYSFMLSLSGATPGSTPGLTYQWYSSPAGAGSFAAVAGATDSTYTVNNQFAATDYKMIITCNASGFSDSTPVVSVGETFCFCTEPSWATNPEDPANGAYQFSIYTSPSGVAYALLDQNVQAGLNANGYVDRSTTAGDTATLFTGGSYPTAVPYDLYGYEVETQVWVDFNDNGVFEDSEVITPVFGFSYYYGDQATGTLSIPATADTGYHRLRMRCATLASFSGNVSDPMNPCASGDATGNTYTGGTVSDYMVHILPLPACAGTPAAGSITGPGSVCANTDCTLTDTGFTDVNAVGGITYAWYSSPSGANTFTAISGANATSYDAGSLSASTDYILVVTCANSNQSDTTPVYTVLLNPYYLCYCGEPDGSSLNVLGPNGTPINYVAIQGSSLNNTVSGASTLYQLFYPTTSTTTATLNQGNTYTLIVNNTDGGNQYAANAWIDFDHSGTFDGGEIIPITGSTPAGTQASITFTVPATADTGITGLRIRMTNSWFAGYLGDPCYDWYITTQDYVINIVPPSAACTGTPVAGAAYAPDSICATSTFALTDTGYDNAPGISYQWYSSPAGLNIYTAITGATNGYYLMSGQDSATDYIFVVNCSNSGASDTSNVVTIYENPFELCYCGPLSTSATLNTSGEVPIHEVSIATTTLDNIDNSNDAYQRFYPTTSSTTATLNQGTTYTISIGVNNVFGFPNYGAAVWIDYDHSGTFDGTPEFIPVTANSNSGISSTATFTVPLGADTGITGLRVRSFSSDDYAIYGVNGGSGCTNVQYGTTQDYLINIVPGVPCTGTPVAGVISSSMSTVCPGTTFTLTDAGYTPGVIDLDFQWYASPSGLNTYIAIAGATGFTYNMNGQDSATDYKIIVTCSTTGTSDTSNVITVTENPFYVCYCGPQSTGDALGSYPLAAPLNLVSITSTSLDNVDNSDLTYELLYPSTTSTTTSLQQGSTYTINVESTDGYTGYAAAVWIDYDHSGTFDDIPEYVFITSGQAQNSIASTSFTIPLTADTGLTGMRVRVVAEGSGVPGGTDACTVFDQQNTQDYVIDITHIGCLPTAVGATAVGSGTASISWNSEPGAVGYEYTVDTSSSNPTGSGTATTDTTANLTGLMPNTIYYAHVRTSCDSGSYSTWSTIVFVTGACDTITISATNISDTSATISWSNLGATGYEYTVDTTVSAPVVAGTADTGTTVTVTTLLPGVTYYAHVRVVCGGGYSSWVTISFTTGVCDTVMGLTANALSDSTASISWNAAGGAGYQYVVDTNPAPPTSGTFTTATTDTAHTLQPNTQYYAHVRVVCVMDSNITSSWITIPFMTPDLGVKIINGSSFNVQAYPNPAMDLITVQVEGAVGNNREAALTDVAGRIITVEKMVTDKVTIDMKNLAAGIYLIKYKDDTHTRVIKVNKQ